MHTATDDSGDRATALLADQLTGDSLEMLHESRQKLPWFLVSVACHALLFFILSLIVFDRRESKVDVAVVSPIILEEPPTFDDPPPETSKLEHPLETQEQIDQVPVIKEVMEDHAQTDDDAPTEDAIGDPDLHSDKPASSQWTSPVTLGQGPGGGGMFGNRTGGRKNVGQIGGTPGSERAVESGLKWLADHQSASGSWDSAHFDAECGRVGRKGDEAHAPCAGASRLEWTVPGNTGLALLAFLGAGNTHRSGEYSDVVKSGLRYLQGVQTPDGCFGTKDGHFMYNHAIAALAMTEAYAMSGGSPLLRSPAQKGVDFLALAQNPGLAWRYSVRPGDNDTSVTGWVVMALKSARVAGLTVPRECFTGALTWIDKVTDQSYGKVGYQRAGDPGARPREVADKFDTSEAMTAVGMISRIFLGAKRSDPALRHGAELLVESLPEWNDHKGTIDMYYWYYGTLAMFQVGGEPWKRWNKAMQPALVDTQLSTGGQRGSWDPIGPWGGSGGRVYSTAINVLSLEIYYRYARVFGGR